MFEEIEEWSCGLQESLHINNGEVNKEKMSYKDVKDHLTQKEQLGCDTSESTKPCEKNCNYN